MRKAKSSSKPKPARKAPAKNARGSSRSKPAAKSKSAPTKAAKPAKPAPAAKPAGKAVVKKLAAKAPAARKAPARVARTVTKAAKTKTDSTKKEKPVSTGAEKKKSGAEIVLDPNYRPGEDEPFMNERQRAYFRNKLRNWKDEIIRQNRETLAGLHEDSTQHADLADRATSETDRALELRARDRQRKLIAKIDAALARIEDGSYGYCEETGEPIGLKRLDARPIATLSLEAQERHERREKVYRED